MRVACIQMRSTLDRAANVEAARALVAEAAEAGAELIATPEMTNVVDRSAKRLLADLPEEDALSEIAAFADMARSLRVHLLVGSLAVKRPDGRAANRAYLFDREGATVATYDKLHMFDVDLANGESWRESKIYGPGDRAVLVEAALAKIGLTICYDVRFPSLYRRLAQAGAEIFFVPAAFTKQTGAAHWHTLLRARAIETGAFVVAPAQGGTHEDGRETYGHSVVVDPWGRIVAEKADDAPGLLLAEIDLSAVEEARGRIPNLKLERDYETIILKA